MNIRQFRYTDLESVIRIAKVSFAEEYVARGETPEGFAKQVRMVARGRMLPFKLLTMLSGMKWKLFVAELDGQLEKQIVDPAYLQIQGSAVQLYPEWLAATT